MKRRSISPVNVGERSGRDAKNQERLKRRCSSGMKKRRISPIDVAKECIREGRDQDGFEKRYINDQIGEFDSGASVYVSF